MKRECFSFEGSGKQWLRAHFSLQQVCRPGVILNNVAASGGFSCLHRKVCFFLLQCSLDAKVFLFFFLLIAESLKCTKLSSSPDFCPTIEIPLKLPPNL